MSSKRWVPIRSRLGGSSVNVDTQQQTSVRTLNLVQALNDALDVALEAGSPGPSLR